MTAQGVAAEWPSSTYNKGYAKCAVLNGGTKMRVQVQCNSWTSWHEGNWVWGSNVWSTYACDPGETVYKVKYQIV